MSADLWRPGPHVYHLGGGELSVGDQQRIPVQHLPPQRGRLWGPHLVSLPHLLVVRHHPQHGGAHLPLRQVSLNASKHLMLTVPLVSQAQNVPAQYTTSDGLAFGQMPGGQSRAACLSGLHGRFVTTWPHIISWPTINHL